MLEFPVPLPRPPLAREFALPFDLRTLTGADDTSRPTTSRFLLLSKTPHRCKQNSILTTQAPKPCTHTQIPCPPVTSSVTPLTKLAIGLAKNRMALATSSGSAERPSGIAANLRLSSAPSLACGMPSAIFWPLISIAAPAALSWVRRVLMKPGAARGKGGRGVSVGKWRSGCGGRRCLPTTLARTLKGPHSLARVLVNCGGHAIESATESDHRARLRAGTYADDARLCRCVCISQDEASQSRPRLVTLCPPAITNSWPVPLRRAHPPRSTHSRSTCSAP